MQTNEQYYHMAHESLVNGQRTQARNQFNEMPKENKKELINYIEDPADKKFFFDEL